MTERATITLTYPGLDGDGNTMAISQTTEVTLADDSDNPAILSVMRPVDGGMQKIEIGVVIHATEAEFRDPAVTP